MGDNKSSFFLFGGFAALIILVLYLISGSGGGNSPLDRSAIGTSGLVSWLKSHDNQVVEAHRRIALTEDEVDLRLLPLHDTNLEYTQTPAASREEQLAQTTQRDIDFYIVDQKTQAAPSLVMLPKWRTGVLMLGVAHESLLIPSSELKRLGEQLALGQARIIRPDVKLLEARVNETGDTVVLYQPQLFQTSSVSGACFPVFSIPQGVLIMTCDFGGRPVTYLSDPDLMNNHGLSLGANSSVALTAIALLRNGTDGALYHDTSDDILLSWRTSSEQREPVERPRTTEDVSRYFSYPFTLIWLATALVLLVAGWRGLVRFGPPVKAFNDTIGASKTASIAAKAYLLRLTGQDHALLAEYADNKLNDLSRDLYGKGIGKDRKALFDRLSKLAPKTAGSLMDATQRMITTTSETSPSELSRIMQEFDTSYRSICDELGRIPRPR